MKIEINDNASFSIICFVVCMAAMATGLGGCWMCETTDRIAIQNGVTVYRSPDGVSHTRIEKAEHKEGVK